MARPKKLRKMSNINFGIIPKQHSLSRETKSSHGPSTRTTSAEKPPHCLRRGRLFFVSNALLLFKNLIWIMWRFFAVDFPRHRALCININFRPAEIIDKIHTLERWLKRGQIPKPCWSWLAWLKRWKFGQTFKSRKEVGEGRQAFCGRKWKFLGRRLECCMGERKQCWLKVKTCLEWILVAAFFFSILLKIENYFLWTSITVIVIWSFCLKLNINNINGLDKTTKSIHQFYLSSNPFGRPSYNWFLIENYNLKY